MEEIIEQEQQQPESTPAEPTEQAVNTENAEPSKPEGEQKPEKTFTQKELDEIVTKRIEREREATAKRVAQESRDAYIAEQGWVDHKGNPITTEAAYKQALKEQEMIDQYKSKELPDDVIQELVEGKKFRETYTQQQKESEQRAKQEEDFKQFLETFPDVQTKDIPVEVWAEVDKGRSLVDAFTRHENKVLREQITKLTEKQQIEQQNAENAAISTGSVTGQGTATATRFTREQVAAMSVAETNKHWTAIQDSMKHWK